VVDLLRRANDSTDFKWLRRWRWRDDGQPGELRHTRHHRERDLGRWISGGGASREHETAERGHDGHQDTE